MKVGLKTMEVIQKRIKKFKISGKKLAYKNMEVIQIKIQKFKQNLKQLHTVIKII